MCKDLDVNKVMCILVLIGHVASALHNSMGESCANGFIMFMAIVWLFYCGLQKQNNTTFSIISTGISDADIVNVTLPTGTPILIELDENFRPTKPMQLLGDQKAIQAAIRKVEDQGKVKQTAWA